jgi:xanthosine utilization system XapX-like protein
MSLARLITAFLAAIAIGATPAMASAISVDAPGDVMLFGLGVVGLLIGRQVSKRRKKHGSDEPG